MKTILILGATSDIARATALAFGLEGWNLWLAGRDTERLETLAKDMTIRTGCEPKTLFFDACQPECVSRFWKTLPEYPDAVLCAVGLLGDQKKAEHNTDLAQRILTSNFYGLLPVLSEAANTYEQRGEGLIIGISSVAGDRGRASNYIYGSAKAGFNAFLSGLRNRLSRKGVRVITVKPGFVATSMTAHLVLPPLLTATPHDVAHDILNGVQHGKDVIYTRWFWKWIMAIICMLPEKLFKTRSL